MAMPVHSFRQSPNNVDALATDQRGAGFDRVVDGRADIGAFETQGVSAPFPAAAPLLVPLRRHGRWACWGNLWSGPPSCQSDARRAVLLGTTVAGPKDAVLRDAPS